MLKLRNTTQPSRWSMLQERRARAHREFCAKAANKVIKELYLAGVDAVIFGSLAGDPRVFRSDSDVDLCLIKMASVPWGEIEAVVHKHLGSVKYDLVEFEAMSSAVRQQVIKNGVCSV